MDTGPQAYGAGKAGGEFNLQNFVRKPTVIVRLLSLVMIITTLLLTVSFSNNQVLIGRYVSTFTVFFFFIDRSAHTPVFPRRDGFCTFRDHCVGGSLESFAPFVGRIVGGLTIARRLFT